MHAGDQTGETAEGWIASQTRRGWFYYGYPDMWYLSNAGMAGLSSAYQLPLYTMTDSLEVMKIAGLEARSYAFYFGMDTTLNGLLDGTLTYDRNKFLMDESDGYAFPMLNTGQTSCYDDNGEAIDCPKPG